MVAIFSCKIYTVSSLFLTEIFHVILGVISRRVNILDRAADTIMRLFSAVRFTPVLIDKLF